MRSKTAIRIEDRNTNKLVPATLISGVTIREAQLAQSFWSTELEKLLNALPKEKWPEHGGWDWETKHRKYGRLAAYQFYGVECDGKMQGLSLLSTLFRASRVETNKQKPIVYVLYLASAPWNLPWLTNCPKYKLVGSVLIATAIQVSRSEGCEGRIGLHALEQSERFYRRSCKMTDLGIDDEHDERLRYFEMTKRGAEAFSPEEK